MEVELPTYGCNIINSANTFYNYSTDGHTREYWIIYEGKALLQSSTYNQYGYTYTGTCLTTNDLIYKPELKIYMPIFSFMIVCAAILLAYKIVLWRFIK